MRDQEERKRYLEEEVTSGRDLSRNEEFLQALKECRDDELLYLIAEQAPSGIGFSYGDIAAGAIRSEEYRYAMMSSSITGRRRLIHELAVARELDELSAVRILLTDREDENRREALYVIGREGLLMPAYLQSSAFRSTAKERLKEIGSAYPERFYEMDEPAKEALRKEWLAEACDFAERLVEKDREIDRKLSENVEIDSDVLRAFLAACHPDPEQRIAYARKITSQRLAAYAGILTDDPDVRTVLSAKVHREDVLELLPYCDSITGPLLLKARYENHEAFCREVLRNAERNDTKEFLAARMKEAGMEMPDAAALNHPE
jgi:hypothetical protein